ncbi:MAG TPA: RNase adapter RapZ [Acidimicrobiales bacterium]|nr:RNase adapter RapZ [Acidimicrobiales bacterium]
MSEYLLITGMSGAGRSQAGATLEDLGWFVIDNLPTPLLPDVVTLSGTPEWRAKRVVLVIGRDAGQLDDLAGAIVALKQRAAGAVTTLFLDAGDDVLIRRFEGTRRRHPLGRKGVVESIAVERQHLEPVRALADVVIDTSDLNVHQLRERLTGLFRPGDETSEMLVSVVSFGFKHGVPLDADSLFDVRFLPNPHWHDDLRPLTGIDAPVREFVLGQPEAGAFLSRLDDLLGLLLPAYVREGKAYLTLAIGCTGGQHRSVAIAEEVAARIRAAGYRPSVQHRDIGR